MKKVLVTISMALFLFGSTGLSLEVSADNIGSGWSPVDSNTGTSLLLSDIGTGWSPMNSDDPEWSMSFSDIGTGW